MTRFLVVGDLSLDVTVAPSRPPRPGGDVPATIRLGPGGQAANVAVRLARRGAEVGLAAAVGEDRPGELLRTALAAEGVTLHILPAVRSATVVALLDAAGERTMLSDRQVLQPDPVAEPLRAADWVHCSGYALLDDEVGDRLAAVLRDRPQPARLSVGGGSLPPEPGLVGRFRARLATARPQMLILSRDEAASLAGGGGVTGAAAARVAAERLAALAPVVIVTAGIQGSAAHVTAGAKTADVEVAAVEGEGPVLDATGAGDAYAAALIGELAGGPWPPAPDALQAAMGGAALAGAAVARVVGAQGRVASEAGPA